MGPTRAGTSAGHSAGGQRFEEIAGGNVVRALDMSVFWAGGPDPERDACGCVIGVTASLFPKETLAAFDAIQREKDHVSEAGAAARVLGLSPQQSLALFYGRADGDGPPLDELTVAQVTSAIDEVLAGTDATGIWKAARTGAEAKENAG